VNASCGLALGEQLNATIVVRKARAGLQDYHATDIPADNHPDRNERPDNILERRELEALIPFAIRELPEPQREAVALFYFEGYDTDAAARFLDVSARYIAAPATRRPQASAERR
jgi:DNA-directed RNA polymerase specialized sigma24 family protein